MKNKLSSLGGLVYSTEAGRMCPACRQPVAQCICKQAVVPAGDGTVRVSRETKGRGGKAVTLVKGLGAGFAVYHQPRVEITQVTPTAWKAI